MNLTDAADIKINGKEVQQVKIDGNIVYTAGYRIRITTDKTYILTGETATLTVKCEDLPFTQIELYNVIDMVQTKIADLTTDSNGQATYTYTGDGSGEIGFLAKYDEKESNMVIIDDYIPVYHPVLSNWPTTITYGHANRGLVVVARDQHDEKANGVTVVFKEGDTVLDTIVTAGSTPGTMGTATLDLNSLSGGVHTIYAVIGSTSSTHTATITVNKANTSLAISVPALVYSDNFKVTGVLKDAYDSPVSEATVRLKWNVGSQENSTTGVTDSEGKVTFETQAPTSITDYTFQLEFDGNSNYNASASSVIQRTVGKETSVLSISSPASPASVSGSSFIMTGTLFDNDGEALEGADILVEEYVASVPATVTIATAEVDENGDWSCEIPTTYMDDGDNTITVQYAGNRLYTSAVQSFTVRKVSFDGIDLDSDKSILSKADNEYAVLTAQLTLNDVPVAISGETVTFEVRKVSDDSLVETLTDDTDSSGIATVSYYGKGVGDIYIKAECNLLIQTYTVKDALLHKNGSCSKDNDFTYDFGSTSDVEITTVASATSQGFALYFGVPNDAYCSVGVGGLNKITTYNKASGGGQVQSEKMAYTYNSEFTVVTTRSGNNITQKINGATVTDTSLTGMSNATKVYSNVWNNLTVTYDIIVMPL